MTQNFWDNQYAVEGYKYGIAPNRFLADNTHRLSASSRVLLPGDGEGRNSVWLASLGHQVTSVDGSAVGVQKAQSLAEHHAVTIQAVHADLQNWVPDTASYDAVVLTYLHLPEALRTQVHRQSVGALQPGGLLLLEAFHPEQLRYQSGGPKSADLLYTLSMLETDFKGRLETLLAWEGEIALDEGPGHQGTAYVTRWIGRTL